MPVAATGSLSQPFTRCIGFQEPLEMDTGIASGAGNEAGFSCRAGHGDCFEASYSNHSSGPMDACAWSPAGEASSAEELETVRRERDDALQLVRELAAQAAGLLVMLDERCGELARVRFQRDMLHRQLEANRAVMVQCAGLLAQGRLQDCVHLALTVAKVCPRRPDGSGGNAGAQAAAAFPSAEDRVRHMAAAGHPLKAGFVASGWPPTTTVTELEPDAA